MKKQMAAWAGALLLLAGCGSGSTEPAGDTQSQTKETIRVYTTIYPLEYFAERIGGSTVEVESIMPPGADEHTYEPTSQTMMDLAEADLFLYNGFGLEPFAEKVEQSLAEEPVEIVNIGEQVDIGGAHEEHLHEEEADSSHAAEENHAGEEDGHNHGETDPHIWLDPLLAGQAAEAVKNELTALHPEQEQLYNENYSVLLEELQELDAAFHAAADAAVQKEILVSHAAYGYWEASYGIEQLSVAGVSSTDEPSQKELKELADTAEAHGIQYVLFEQNITPKIAKVIQNEIGADALHLHNLGTLTEENIQNGDDYFSIMKQNIETLKTAMNE